MLMVLTVVAMTVFTDSGEWRRDTFGPPTWR
jgi:hypothetical protein